LSWEYTASWEHLFVIIVANVCSFVKINLPFFSESFDQAGIERVRFEYIMGIQLRNGRESLMSKGLLHSLWDWTKTGLVAITAAILINAYVLQAFQVKGESMLPTLHNSDSTFALKLQPSYDYGDIVIIDSRIGEDRSWYDPVKEHPLVARLFGNISEYLWVKRVIGKPGDTLEFRDGRVIRNGTPLEEPYILEPMAATPEAIVVPEEHVYVMGDNRNNSTDSRVIGSIPLSNVIGKVIFTY
jgi:signal peptidase I